MQSTQLLLVSTLIIAFVLSVSAASTRKWKCDAQSKKEVDEMVARIMTYGRVDRVFPIDKNELRSYCKEQSQMISRLEDYKTQCLKGRSKQTVSIIIYSMKNINNLYCKNPSSKRSNDLLNSASCANEATAEYNKCNIDYIDLLLAVENSKDSKQQLSQLCCGYAEVFKCIREKGSLIEMCNDDKIETNINYIRGFFDNAANLICGDFTVDTDKCDKVKMFRKKNKQPSKRPNSYFNPLVNLLSSL